MLEAIVSPRWRECGVCFRDAPDVTAGRPISRPKLIFDLGFVKLRKLRKQR